MVLNSPAVRVRPGQRITVDGKLLPTAEATRLFRYHKPKGVVTAARDPEGRATIYDTHARGPAAPDADRPPRYRAPRACCCSPTTARSSGGSSCPPPAGCAATGCAASARVDDRHLKALAQGVTVDGIAYGPIQAQVDRTQGDNAWLTVSLREGKNREVRRVLEHVGLQVNRLIRIAYGPFQLGLLPKRAVEEVLGKVLREQVGAMVEKPVRARPAATGAGTG